MYPLASLTVSPGSSHISWKVYLASLVAVSREVRQKTEIARISMVCRTFCTPDRPGIVATMEAMPMEKTCIGFVTSPLENLSHMKPTAQIVQIPSTHSISIEP